MAIFGTANAKTAPIADGESLSSAVDLGSMSLVGLATPSDWTTAAITFQVSPDGTTWYDYESADGTEVAIGSTAAEKYRALAPADFAGARYLKVRSGTSGSPVTQSGGVVVSLVVRGL